MDKKRIMHLRGVAQGLEVTVHVGKDGVTEKVAEEVVRQLKKHRLVKIRLLPSLEQDKRDAAQALAAASEAVLVEVRGRTVVLAKE